jgi:DNA-directed RNA polymerase subunit RPC12/RpoP
MRITCFQCRQQLDVPADSAGRRVRCPHCEYVIVVPTQRPVGDGGEAATALPSLELDAELDRPIETKVAPMPLPPIAPAPEEKATPKPASFDDFPPLPPLEKTRRRRVSMSPLAKPGLPWGRIVVIGAVIMLVVIGVIVGLVSSQSNRRRQHFQVAVNPPQQFQPPVQKKPFDFEKPPLWQPRGFPKPNPVLPPVNLPPWRDYQNQGHRFRTQFPGGPIQMVQQINGAPITVFEVKHFTWEFAVGHRTLAGRGIPDFQHVGLFINTEVHLRNLHGGFRTRDIPIQLKGGHPGQEWDFALPNNARMFAQTFLVRDGDTQHHYVLTVRTPNNVQRFHPDVVRFFNAFQSLDQSKGMPFHEDMDDILRGARRDNEITTFAWHPKKPIAAFGNQDGSAVIVQANQRIQFTPEIGKAIEQVGVSPDGQWLGIAVGGNLHFRKAWENGGNFADNFLMPGHRFVFAKKAQHLFLANRDEVMEVKLGQEVPIAAMPIADLPIDGFAVSSDQRTVAIFGGKAVALLDWTQKKQLGRFDAHAAPITSVV